MKKILVIGSSNIDMVAHVDHLPAPGETVGGANFMQTFGGKGANQAVAASRLGADVTFVTCLGTDIYADSLKSHFAAEKIRTNHIVQSNSAPTGIALILVSAANAENSIAVAPGANNELKFETHNHLEELIAEADILLMQAEIPYQTVRQSALVAHKHGIKVIFNPAPACEVDQELMHAIDTLILNEIEASVVSGMDLNTHTLKEVAGEFIRRGVRSVVITLGKAGVYTLTSDSEYQLPAFKVQAIDTTAAGDTFCGALAVAMSDNGPDAESLRFSCAAAAIAVTKAGAQTSIPRHSEVTEFLKNA